MPIEQARCLLYGQVFRKCSVSKLCRLVRRPCVAEALALHGRQASGDRGEAQAKCEGGRANNLINELEATYIFKSGRKRTLGKQMIFCFLFHP
jgi:hypothetical protein